MALGLAGGCTRAPSPEHHRRVQDAKQGLSEDPLIRAREAGVEAAMRHEKGEIAVDEVELRVGDEYDSEHMFRMRVRVPVKRPGDITASRDALRADTEIAVTRLEQASLQRRAEICFPSVDILVHQTHGSIYDAYARRQKALLEWSQEWRESGMIDELSAARFEIESRVKLATRQPPRPPAAEVVVPVLPEIEARPSHLVREPSLLRETVRHHHPSVALRLATAERYQALSKRARSRARPWLKFVDVSYEHAASGRDGLGGKLSFEIPLGMRERANAGRYQSLVRQEENEGEYLLEEQVRRSLEALDELADFESRTEQWEELEQLAGSAEETADRWWRERLARPSQVAALLDEAFSARITVLDARERAAVAGCTLFAMTGLPPEDWPRE